MIHFEGVESFPQPVAEVAAKLSDAGFLAQCIPDAQVTLATPDRSIGKIKPQLSFLTGSLTLEADVTARDVGQVGRVPTGDEDHRREQHRDDAVRIPRRRRRDRGSLERRSWWR